MISIVFIAVYLVTTSFLFLFTLTQGVLALNYRRALQNEKTIEGVFPAKTDNFPKVLVQLPIFNEFYVVERLLENIAKLDYPRNLLEIQVLDDSTDETSKILADKVSELANAGFDIRHIQRENRVGYKAGALQAGLKQSDAPFVVIFDSDFLPKASFIKSVLPYFDDKNIGMVQTRWSHINENYSILTKLLAFALDAHFSVEQKGRNFAGHFINFNGTSGMWRRQTIDDAGGWKDTSITEDLDLSYRAQFIGWKFKYVEQIDSPSEIPASMHSIKIQQFRWTKGPAEIAVVHLKRLLTSDIAFKHKWFGAFHLLTGLLPICLLLSGISSIVLTIWPPEGVSKGLLISFSGLFTISFVSLVFFYWTSRIRHFNRIGVERIGIFIFKLIMFMMIYLGLSIHNAIAGFEGFIGKKTPFVRTPKHNIKKVSDNWRDHTRYMKRNLPGLFYLELMAALIFGTALLKGLFFGPNAFVTLHIMYTVGFGLVCYFTVTDINAQGTE